MLLVCSAFIFPCSGRKKEREVRLLRGDIGIGGYLRD